MAFGRPSGVNWIAGGAVAAVLIPVLAIGFAVPYWIAFMIALLAGGGVVVLLAPRTRFEGMDANAIGRGRIELARELLGEAEPLVARMQAAAQSLRSDAVRDRVGHLAICARGILDAIEQDPVKIEPARRFLTYYLPRAAEMAEGYRMQEQMKLPDPGRLQATADLLNRLDTAFAKFADGLLGADMSRLDIELKLLKGSLDDDLGPVAGTPAAATSPWLTGRS
jgi:5-bromo-4-chloroindolyl phosphate hydrolysis protein